VPYHDEYCPTRQHFQRYALIKLVQVVPEALLLYPRSVLRLESNLSDQERHCKGSLPENRAAELEVLNILIRSVRANTIRPMRHRLVFESVELNHCKSTKISIMASCGGCIVGDCNFTTGYPIQSAIFGEDIVSGCAIWCLPLLGGACDPPDSHGNLPHAYFILAPEIKRSK
jgi:hypothetical protein